MAAEEGTELIASGPRKRARSPDRSVPPKKRFLPNQRRYSSSSSAGSGDDIAKSDGKVRGDSPPHSADGGDEVLRLTEMALAFLHEACAQPPSPDAGQASDAPSEGSSSSPSAASSFSMGTRSGSGSGDVSSRSSSGDPDDGLDDLTLALLLDSSDGEGAAAHGASSASRSAKKSRGNKSHTTSGKAPARGGRAPSTANKPRGSCRGKTQPKVKAKIFLKTTTTDGAVTAVSLSSLVDHNLLQVGAEVFIRDCPKARAQVVPCEAPAGSKSSNQYQLKYQLDGKTVVRACGEFPVCVVGQSRIPFWQTARVYSAPTCFCCASPGGTGRCDLPAAVDCGPQASWNRVPGCTDLSWRQFHKSHPVAVRLDRVPRGTPLPRVQPEVPEPDFQACTQHNMKKTGAKGGSRCSVVDFLFLVRTFSVAKAVLSALESPRQGARSAQLSPLSPDRATKQVLPLELERKNASGPGCGVHCLYTSQFDLNLICRSIFCFKPTPMGAEGA